jgi:hypothetical protein
MNPARGEETDFELWLLLYHRETFLSYLLLNPCV